MKDARLVANYQYAQKLDANIVDGKTVIQESWFEQAVAAIVKTPLLMTFESRLESCQDFEKFVEQIEKSDRNELPGQAVAIIEQLPTGFPDELDAVSSGDHEASNHAAWVWGSALARICAGSNSIKELLEAGWRLAGHEVAAEAFLEGVTSALVRENADCVHAALNDLVDNIAEQPELCVYSSERERFCQAVEDWKEEADLSKVWSLNAFEYFPVYCESIGVLEAVRRSDPSQYLKLLELTALPPAIENAFRRLDIFYDFDVILQLLSVAPSILEPDGNNRVWNRKLTAPILLNKGLEHIRDLADVIFRTNDEERDKAESIRDREAHSLLCRLTEALLGRQDGTFLAVHWMCHLIGTNGPKPWSNTDRWTPIPSTIEAVASGLHSKGIQLEDIVNLFPKYAIPKGDDLIKLHQSGIGDLDRHAKPSGLDILLAYLWIINQADTEISLKDEMTLNFFETLLVRQDGGLYIAIPEACPTVREYYPALLYATHDHPVETWSKSWALLSEQRRLFRHRWSDDTVPRSEDPSFCLANIGLATVDWLISPEVANFDQALPLWRTIFDAVFNVVITPPSFNNDHWRNLIAKLFSRLPLVSTPSDRSSIVVEYLLRLGGDDELFIWCLANACQNGALISDVALTIKHSGADLRNRMDAYIKWEGRDSNRRKNDKVMEVCQNLLQQLQP
ncbi:hypothetical protein [Geotalea uraniireducens]|uniref:Uncharacterized protein n=1 Tax=Geotalea uraniireducens (strain Rf4) TaxID=351605 RepID=A5G5M4_GEOUR|nr:hypothetical protein [Geotalea uraniireducens]ABQ27092.1 hypothetical protein Gura_2920 [Geotalea uraniireducens Rf4]